MSVIVKGMKMPKNCLHCDFDDSYGICACRNEAPYVCEYSAKQRPSWCPLEDLPSAQEKRTEERTETHGVCLEAIDADGLDEEIRCEMCENPMHTDRGCDGNCKYDEILYEKIIQILNKRITQLPSAQPEIVRCKDCKWFHDIGCAIRIVDDSDKPSENDYCSFAERRTDGV